MNPLNPYSVLILLTGLALATFCVVLIIYDNKKLLSYIKLTEEREQQLKEVISDAELIIEELNKFSDYIMNEMEKKKNEYQDTMQCIETDIGKLNQKTGELLNSLNSIQKDTALLKEEKSKDKQRGLQDEPLSLNSKYSEVLRLSREGVEAAEIARRLCMGKGEVQLVLKSSNRTS
jgi:F0F1-type ATP synthase membrane subunit b/b'